MAAINRGDGVVVAAFEAVYLVPTLALIGALLAGAVIIAVVRRWQRNSDSLGPNPSDQLAQYRSLYEQGAISEEEYRRLRTVLGGELRRSADLPVRPAEGIKPAPDTQPPPPTGDVPPADSN